MRLRRTDPSQPGFTRRRRGKGWQFLDASGVTVRDPELIERFTGLVIPPAWKDVWISAHANGHLQAVGTDAAGRRQYQYHPEWANRRALRKFERILGFGDKLPTSRVTVDTHLNERGMPREKALATAFRLLDLGHFRIGGEVYAETNGSFGLASLRKEHVRREGKSLVFDYTAKHGIHRVERIVDPQLLESVGRMKSRRTGPEQLLVFKENGDWRHVGTSDINTYLKDVLAPGVSAKDFRTWHGTTLAAVALAQQYLERPEDKKWSKTAAAKAVRQAVVAVSERLGNTPSVCRGSYIDPRIITAFEQDVTVSAAVTSAMHTLADSLPDVVDQESAGEVLTLIAAAPDVERAVLTLLRS